MRRLALSLAVLALPVSALAVFAKPSELLNAMQFEGKPLDVAYEAHAQMDDIYASVWLKGNVEGTDAEDAKANLRLTVDFVQGEENLRGKAQLRLIDKTLYMMLDSITCISGNPCAYVDLAEGYANNQWYSLSLENLQEQQGVDDAEAEAIVKIIVDAALSLERTQSGNESTYSLKLKRAAAAELKKVVTQLAKDHPSMGIDTLSSKDSAELRKIFAKTNLHIKAVTTLKDEPKSLKMYLAYADKDVRFVLQGAMTLRTAPVKVLKPANAISLDNGLEEQLPLSR